MQWYYVENGQQAGPVEDDVLASMVREGRIDQQTLVWNTAMANWEPYGQVMGRAASGVRGAGVATQANTAVCVECGRVFPTEDMILYSGSHVCAECKPVFFQKIKEGITVGQQLQYAGFWIRAGAKIIDGLLLFIIQFPLNMIFGVGFSAGASGFRQLTGAVIALSTLPGLIGIAIHITYYVYFHGRTGQTPGKKACGIRVIRPDGAQISFARALGRFFADMLSGLILYVGFIMAGFDNEKRALHDRICDTRVVYWSKK